jgi:hypothetical protein
MRSRISLPSRRPRQVVRFPRTPGPERDITAVYTILTMNGISQRTIAALTGQAQSEVSAIRKGRQLQKITSSRFWRGCLPPYHRSSSVSSALVAAGGRAAHA